VKRMIVRYKTKPDQADENARLIAAVFQELHAAAPDGVRYLALRLADGSFVHFVSIEDGAPPLAGLPAFRVFQGGVKDRCIEPPLALDATIVGDYRMLGA
jgi:hypothetical protein